MPIIILHQQNQETDRVWGMRQGARGYITKPVDAAEAAKPKIAALNELRCLWRTVKPSRIFNPVWPGACGARSSEGVSVAAWLAVQAGGRDYCCR